MTISATCGGRITVSGTAGSVTSPNFPNNYDANLDCFWVIQGPVGHYLTINITQMQLQSSSYCSADFLEIIDPGMAPNNASITLENPETSPAVRGLSVAEARANASGGSLYRGCGQPYFYPPGSNSFETADNRAYIWFKSDSQDSQSGFQINFSASFEGKVQRNGIKWQKGSHNYFKELFITIMIIMMMIAITTTKTTAM